MESLNFMTLKLKVLMFSNITMTGVIENVDHNPIISKNYAAVYQTLEEVPGPLLPEKNQEHEKNCLNS